MEKKAKMNIFILKTPSVDKKLKIYKPIRIKIWCFLKEITIIRFEPAKEALNEMEKNVGEVSKKI